MHGFVSDRHRDSRIDLIDLRCHRSSSAVQLRKGTLFADVANCVRIDESLSRPCLDRTRKFGENLSQSVDGSRFLLQIALTTLSKYKYSDRRV